MSSTDQAAGLRARFAARLGEGHAAPWWRQAFADVPRHLFVPRFYDMDQGRPTEVTEDSPGYWERVYSDNALVTQVDDKGIPTSSSSQPTTMLTMLEALDVEEGNTVFELGTGTGYNAALMSHRLGAENVTSVDVDPELVDLAARRLGVLGPLPYVFAADGALGCPERAPYDRLIATAAIRAIPPAFLDQAKPGAVIVAPIGFGLARLTVSEPGHADGRFLALPAFFMPRRVPGRAPDFQTLLNQEPDTTSVPAADVLTRLDFPLSLALPGHNSCTWRDDNGELTSIGLWTEDGSTATAHVNGRVRQTGPQRLWDVVEALSACFPAAPGREDFGVTVRPGGQRVWYGSPDGPAWTLPAA